MNATTSAADKERVFRAVYADVHRDLERFVRRRAGPEVVEEVLADTFLVVWRRLDDVPAAPEDARAWTFAVARHVLLTQHRADRRRQALGLRLTADATTSTTSADEADTVARRVELARAWDRLSQVHQESLGLSVLEGLDATRAAAVLDISPVAYRLRLSRARRALRAHLDHQPPSSRARRGTPERSTP